MNKIIGIVLGKKPGDWQRIDADGSNIEVEPGTFDTLYAGIKPAVIDEQHMIEIPAYHYRSATIQHGENAGKKAIWFSPRPEDGFKLHPAFRHQDQDLDRFWLGAYQGTPDGPDKLGSQPGNMPLTNIDFPTMQARAGARGDGWMLWSAYQLAAVQMLALIETGNADAQQSLGRGHVDGGGVKAVDDTLVIQASWRGITGLWGNVWQMLDGLRTDNEGNYLVWDEDGSCEYRCTEVQAPDGGWFRRRSSRRGEGFDLGALFLPKKTHDDYGKGCFADYFWAYSNAVAYHGGNYGDGASAGLFDLDVYLAASYASTGIGGRLAKV